MPVGAGSIKRAAKTAATNPENEKTQDEKTKVQQPKVQPTQTKPTAKSPRKATTTAANTKVEAKKDAKQPKAGSTAQKQIMDPDRLDNQIYHITDELPVHLL